MRKTTLLFIISILIGYYATPAMAQRANNKNKLIDNHKDNWRDSCLLSDYPNTPLTTPYHLSNSEDDAKILNVSIPDFQVNENSNFSLAPQSNPSISADKDGNFILTWQDERNGNYDIYFQRYSSDGTAQGSNFKANDDMARGSKNYPRIAVNGIGNFTITWMDRRNSNWDIYAQLYSSDGTALGSNFKVNDDIGGTWQNRPSISADGSGNFIITWSDERNGNDDIYAQRYSSDGTALGSNFKVNDDKSSSIHWRPSISAVTSGLISPLFPV